MLQDVVTVVVDGEAEGSITSFQTTTLNIQILPTFVSLSEMDITTITDALETVYEDESGMTSKEFQRKFVGT